VESSLARSAAWTPASSRSGIVLAFAEAVITYAATGVDLNSSHSGLRLPSRAVTKAAKQRVAKLTRRASVVG
jgi:hypothetical protein